MGGCAGWRAFGLHFENENCSCSGRGRTERAFRCSRRGSAYGERGAPCGPRKRGGDARDPALPQPRIGAGLSGALPRTRPARQVPCHRARCSDVPLSRPCAGGRRGRDGLGRPVEVRAAQTRLAGVGWACRRGEASSSAIGTCHPPAATFPTVQERSGRGASRRPCPIRDRGPNRTSCSGHHARAGRTAPPTVPPGLRVGT